MGEVIVLRTPQFSQKVPNNMKGNRMFLGENTILQVGIGYLDEMADNLGNEIKMALIQAMGSYLSQNCLYEESQKVFFSLIGRDEPLQKLKEIVDVSEAPISTSENDTTSDDESTSSRKKTRSWTALEDIRLLAGIYRYGVDNWTTISLFVGNGRSRAQCCQRWTRGLNPRISKDTWSFDENLRLVELVKTYGDKSWTKIASMMGNRSDVQCRYHYHQVQRDFPYLFKDQFIKQSSLPNTGPTSLYTQLPSVVAKSNGRSSLPQIIVDPSIINKKQFEPIPIPQLPPQRHNSFSEAYSNVVPITVTSMMNQKSSRRPSLPDAEAPPRGGLPPIPSQKLSKFSNSTSSLDGFLRSFTKPS